jgi:hypothetical protein
MPVNKNAFRRMSALVQILNDRVGGEFMSVQKLHFILNFNYEIECSKSTVEKDLFALKMDFDLPLQTAGRKGYYLEAPFDFLQALKQYLNIFE